MSSLPNFGPPRVLVVEDDLEVLTLIREVVCSCGYTCICASSDVEAYRCIEGPGELAALIADVNLGLGTTGFDVSRQARLRNAALPVFYVTGSGPQAVERFGVEEAVLIEKPFIVDDLITILRETLSSKPEA